jgi:uncharacterized membrane protein
MMDHTYQRFVTVAAKTPTHPPLDGTTIQVCRGVDGRTTIPWLSEVRMATLHLTAGAGDAPASLRIRTIRPVDLKDALARGFDDFMATPTHIMFLCVIYPIVGLVLGRLAFGYDVLPLLFPLVTGFVLIGPFAAIGLYELSRRREQGLEASWTDAFDVLGSPSFAAIAALGFLLMLIFIVWLAVADWIYVATLGDEPVASAGNFLDEILTTSSGWTLIILGNGVGFLFALLVLTISVVSFPLLLDRDVGAAPAIVTSIRVVFRSPFTMFLWGLMVASLLIIGSLPFFIGLAVVIPVLGHSTWHLYRRAVTTA